MLSSTLPWRSLGRLADVPGALESITRRRLGRRLVINALKARHYPAVLQHADDFIFALFLKSNDTRIFGPPHSGKRRGGKGVGEEGCLVQGGKGGEEGKKEFVFLRGGKFT